MNERLSNRSVHNDGISSTQLVTDDSGAQVGRMVYGAWGETLSSSESVPGVLDVRFVGGLGVRNDAATGLIWMRHRWYDPTLNRFISRDPIGFVGDTNLYRYADGQPNTAIDPEGLKAWYDWIGELQTYVDVRAAKQFYLDKASAAIADGYMDGNSSWGGVKGFLWTLPASAIDYSGFENAQTAGETYADPCASGTDKLWATANLGLTALGWIAPLPAVSGPGGGLFGRALITRANDNAKGVRGLFNKGHVRFGWSYNVTKQRNVLALRIGKWHQDLPFGDWLHNLYRRVGRDGLGDIPKFQQKPWEFVLKHK